MRLDYERRVVYLSGLPCTGKTSVLSGLGNQGWATVPEFLEQVPNEVRQAFTGDSEDMLNAQRWVINQHLQKSKMVGGFLESGQNVAVDRGPLDALIYSKTLGENIYRFTVGELKRHRWVDGEVYLLTADSETIMRRFFTRDGWGTLTEESWRQYFHSLDAAYMSFYEASKFANTGLITLLETTTSLVDAIVAMINVRQPAGNLTMSFNKLLQRVRGGEI